MAAAATVDVPAGVGATPLASVGEAIFKSTSVFSPSREIRGSTPFSVRVRLAVRDVPVILSPGALPDGARPGAAGELRVPGTETEREER